MSSHSIRISADLLRDHQVTRNGASDDALAVPEAELCAHKRTQQQRDIASITAGQSTNEAMSWFSGGRARRAKAVNSPL